MGSSLSSMIDPAHIRIYNNILQIQNINTKLQMIQTCLSSQEYVVSSKKAGIYSHLLAYISAIQNGRSPPQLPFSIKNQTESNELIVSNTPALSFFSKCLYILGIREEIELDEELLKSAYRKAALRAHPDKGGSEKQFEEVTRAYAYLSEIIRRVRGNRERSKESPADLPTVKNSRNEDIDRYKYDKPIRIDPNNMNMNAFNKLFEDNKIPEPDHDGYGEWLKNESPQDTKKTKNFDQKFNREVFNRMFDSDEEKNKHTQQQTNSIMLHPESMALVSNAGTELGRERPKNYTASVGSKTNFTDLRDAYTEDSTITHKVIGIQYQQHSGNFDAYKESRKRTPQPLNNTELEQLTRSETELKEREKTRQRRYAEESISNQDYFEKMKRYLIVDG